MVGTLMHQKLRVFYHISTLHLSLSAVSEYFVHSRTSQKFLSPPIVIGDIASFMNLHLFSLTQHVFDVSTVSSKCSICNMLRFEQWPSLSLSDNICILQ